MADTLRIKRRTSGAPGAPASLANAELSYNEVDHVLYYGEGTSGAGGTASVIAAIAGQGLGSQSVPLMDGTGATGTGTTWARSDHQHPSNTAKANLASPTFTGVVTISGTITGAGMTAFMASPPPIGSTAPAAGTFTNLAASGVLSGTAFTNLLASPPAIGGTLPAAGAFTTLSATGVVSGAGFAALLAPYAPLAAPTFTGIVTVSGSITGPGMTAFMATPPAIGATTPAGGAFTTLSASGTVTGAGFSGYLAAPPAIGGTSPAAGSFTNLSATGVISGAGFTALLASPPAIGGVAAAAGTFTNLTASGTVSGAGFAAWLASPPAIGGTLAAAGTFTSLTASGAVSGAGFTTLLAPYAPLASPTHTGVVTINGTITGPGMATWAASPPPIGSTAPSTGAFTTLSATTTVSGVGFTTWLASPPAIGGTAANAGTFTNLTVSGTISGAGATALLSTYAPLASPLFTGAPSMPTGTIGVTQANTVSNTTLATTAFVRSIRLDQFAVPTAPVSMNGQFITNLPLNPVNPGDAASKSYVDQNSAGLVAKGAVAAATTGANIALTGLQTIDGYTTLAADRVLVKDQTLAQNNGIYVASATAWTRATDMDAWTEVPQAYVFVTNGTVNSASSWVCNSPLGGGTLGTTPITWVQFSQQASVTAGAGLTRTGNSFDVIGSAGRIAVFADNVDIDSGYVGQPSITTLGSVTTGTWNAITIAVARGGSGAVTLTGYLKGNGVSPFTASTTIPNTDVAGLGSMATQNANAVVITGGSIDNVTFDMGTF